MGAATDYRQFATEQRNAAETAPLPMVRLKHLSAAERWECLAEQIERCERGMLNLSDGAQELFY